MRAVEISGPEIIKEENIPTHHGLFKLMLTKENDIYHVRRYLVHFQENLEELTTKGERGTDNLEYAKQRFCARKKYIMKRYRRI